MNTLLQDLRSACRSLIKTPTLTLAAVLSLGLGIGANTTVFTWVQAVLLRPVPGAHDPDRLYVPTIATREGRMRSWSLLPGIAPRDPITFIGVPLLLLAIAAIAALIPARRAGAVDPLVALRYE